MKQIYVLLCCCAILFLPGTILSAQKDAASNDPNHYDGTDSERIAKAVQAAPEYNGIVRIPARKPDKISDRTYWLLDSAILLPSHVTLFLENCTLKLSDSSRDNFIRTDNAGIGIEKVQPRENIHVIGIGMVKLIGADHPRATGGPTKILGQRTYGTDAGKPGDEGTGDWRNVGVLFVHVTHFSIKNLSICQPHCWAMSMEKCSFGTISGIKFDEHESVKINGKNETMLNLDGLNLRKGCHDIFVENISGHTGDDMIALTAYRNYEQKGGKLNSIEVSETDPKEKNDIYNITIRNVIGYSTGGHQIIRLLNAAGIKMYKIIISDVIDASPNEVIDKVTIRIGDSAYGGVAPLGDTSRIIVNNVYSRSRDAVLIAGSLTDSIITNVINDNPNSNGVTFGSGEKNVRNIKVDNIHNIK